MAIRKHNFEAINLLLKAGANINVRDGIHTPLSLIHDQLSSPIETEAKEKFRDILTQLYAHGAHVDTPGDTIGWTPLQLTMNFHDTKFYISHAKKLIALGAKLDVQDNVGRTPVMIASALGRLQSLKLLAKEGADLNVTDKYGWSALMLAVYNNHFDVVRALISFKADINLTTKGQLSALKIAIDQKNRRIERYLRDHGASTESI
jgi:ankyrin repeat protein